ncbi:hypothetical protein LWF15_08300 [Kineosporia rhizophila]|uniref:hypothetical protein n=1 Tax=Kineosporia rhizophila TaxID=84633 RepID=UPI001E536924|nr:hypothetical protein [Kineosporia rhizophila]MCE0535508.1 hypothetical protein [Kineosporia rhizophila]
MPAPPRPPMTAGLRWGRGVLVASLAWGAASAGHVLAGGDLPSWPLVAALIAVTAWPLSLTLGRRAGGLQLVTLMTAGQAMMHTALVVTSWYTSGPADVPSPQGHQHTSAPGMANMADMAEAGTGHVMPLLPSPLMLLAHIAAALVVGAILSDGERALFVLLGLLAHVRPPELHLGRRIHRILALLATGVRPEVDEAPRSWVNLSQQRLRERVLVATLGRRGPPARTV